MQHVEVVSSTLGTFELYGRKMMVSASTDVIIRFIEPRFDYLRYLDTEGQCLAIVYMNQPSLATLVQFGLPETALRTTINEDEYEEYLKWQEQIELPTLDRELEEDSD